MPSWIWGLIVNLAAVFYLLAAACFLLVTLGVAIGEVRLSALGLMFVAVGLMVDEWGVRWGRTRP